MTITLRIEKDEPLTFDEVDGNFTDLDTTKADVGHTHVPTEIVGSTAAGRAMLTAADATAQTALLDAATTSLKGLLSSSDKTKLDAITGTNTGDETASGVLTKIKTVDGDGSGLDADKLDGLEATAFALASHTQAASTISDSTSAGRALLTAASAAAQRTTLQVYAYYTRAQLVTAVAGGFVGVDGTSIAVEGLHYRWQNGATAIADLAGLLPEGAVSPLHFGVTLDGADCTAQLQACFTYCAGGTVYLPVGTIKFGQVTLPPQTRIAGAGMNQSILESVVTGTTPAVIITGVAGVSSQQRLAHSGFTLIKNSGIRQGYGLQLTLTNYVTFRDVAIRQFDLGIDAYDSINVSWVDCFIVNNKRGARAVEVAYSAPNSWHFVNTVLNGNTVYCLDFTKPTSLNVHNCNFELNGTDGTSGDSNYWTIRIRGNPSDGGIGLCMTGSNYIEGNKGYADIWIEANDTSDGRHTVNGATFNRLSSTAYVDNNIRLDKSGSGKAVLDVRSAFKGFGTYSESSLRPYINVPSPADDNWRVTGTDECFFENSSAAPAFGGSQSSMGSHPFAWVRFNGSTGAIVNGHNVASITKNGTGDYTITFQRKARSTAHCGSWMINDQNGKAYLSAETQDTIRVKTATGSTLTDYTAVMVTIYNFDMVA